MIKLYKHKFTIGFILFLTILTINVSALEKGNPSVSYYGNELILPDGKKVELGNGYIALFINGTLVTDYEIIIKNGTYMAPVRLISQELSASVSWNQAKGEVSITKGDSRTVLTIGSDKIIVNGKETAMEHPAIIYKDLAYAPLSFFSEILGATVIVAPEMDRDYIYYYDTRMPVSPENTIIRDTTNIIIDESYDNTKAPTMEEAMARAKEICLEGLGYFRESLNENLINSGEEPGRFDGELNGIEAEINRMLYIGEVSRFYKFTIGPYDILYDKYNGKLFFIIYSSGIIIEEVDVHYKGLFIPVFIVG